MVVHPDEVDRIPILLPMRNKYGFDLPKKERKKQDPDLIYEIYLEETFWSAEVFKPEKRGKAARIRPKCPVLDPQLFPDRHLSLS